MATALTLEDLGLITYQEAAAIAGIGPATVRTWAHRYGLTKVTAPDGRLCLVEAEFLTCERSRRRSGRRGGGSLPRTNPTPKEIP